MSPHRRGGGHIVFGADTVVRVTVSCLHKMNRLADFNLICKDITLGHDEELIRFW